MRVFTDEGGDLEIRAVEDAIVSPTTRSRQKGKKRGTGRRTLHERRGEEGVKGGKKRPCGG